MRTGAEKEETRGGEGVGESVPAGFWKKVKDLYVDGFRNMTVGRYLWAIILFKLLILFLVFKLFFFPDLLQRNYNTDEERADAVRSNLIR